MNCNGILSFMLKSNIMLKQRPTAVSHLAHKQVLLKCKLNMKTHLEPMEPCLFLWSEVHACTFFHLHTLHFCKIKLYIMLIDFWIWQLSLTCVGTALLLLLTPSLHLVSWTCPFNAYSTCRAGFSTWEWYVADRSYRHLFHQFFQVLLVM